MPQLSGASVLAIVAVWYALKAILTSMLAGVSMASVEGVADPSSLSKHLAYTVVAPACAYLFGGAILAWETIRSNDMTAINEALRCTFLIHVSMIAAYCIYLTVVAPLAPSLLSYYASPGAQCVAIAAALLPIILFAVIFFSWIRFRISASRV